MIMQIIHSFSNEFYHFFGNNKNKLCIVADFFNILLFDTSDISLINAVFLNAALFDGSNTSSFNTDLLNAVAIYPLSGDRLLYCLFLITLG